MFELSVQSYHPFSSPLQGPDMYVKGDTIGNRFLHENLHLQMKAVKSLNNKADFFLVIYILLEIGDKGSPFESSSTCDLLMAFPLSPLTTMQEWAPSDKP